MSDAQAGPDWKALIAALAQPFHPMEVKFFPKTVKEEGFKNAPGPKGLALAYVDARAVMNRLDEVVGPENWTFDITPVVINATDICVAKGTLTIYGVSKSDVSDRSNMDASKGAASGSLKRAAVMFAIGRYLYAIKATWQPVEKKGGAWAFTEQALVNLRNALPKPDPKVLRMVAALPAHVARIEDDEDEAGAAESDEVAPDFSPPAVPARRGTPTAEPEQTSEQTQALDPRAPASKARVDTLIALYDKAGRDFPYHAGVALTNAMVDSAIEKLKKLGATPRKPIAAGA